MPLSCRPGAAWTRSASRSASGPLAYAAARHADVQLHQHPGLGAAAGQRRRQRVDVPLVINGYGEVHVPGQRRDRLDFLRRHYLVRDEDVRHSGRRHGRRLPDRGHGDPDRAGRQLQQRKVRRLLHLGVRAQPGHLAGHGGGHDADVPLQGRRIDDQGRCRHRIDRLTDMPPVLFGRALAGSPPGLPPVTHVGSPYWPRHGGQALSLLFLPARHEPGRSPRPGSGSSGSGPQMEKSWSYHTSELAGCGAGGASVDLGLQLLDPQMQGVQADPDEVGQEGVIKVRGRGGGTRLLAVDDLTGHADHDRIGRHRLDHYGVRADPAVVTDRDRPEHLAPAPMVTRSPTVGCRLPRSRLVPPSVTPW